MTVLPSPQQQSSTLEQYVRDHGQYGMIGQSPQMVEVYGRIGLVAAHDIPVVILGESGTGKELVAKAIHGESDRGRFVGINCGSLPDSVLESELFGYAAGAFTGARNSGKDGFIKSAQGGTLFLDEINKMSLKMQIDLLRVIQEHQYYKVGSIEIQNTNARIIAAASGSIEDAVANGQFNDALYYRLMVVPIDLHPLRERGEDINLLADYFLTKYAEDYRKPGLTLGEDALVFLRTYEWPGNVRELEALMQRVIILEGGKILQNSGALASEHFERNIRQKKPK